MVELERCASVMLWDWDVDDIDLHEDDGKMWVPVTPQTLKVPTNMRDSPALPPMMPLREMRVYAVQLNQDRSVQQPRMPQMIPMAMLQIQGLIILKAILGRGDSLREEDITADEDGEDDREDECSERNPTKPPVMPKTG